MKEFSFKKNTVLLAGAGILSQIFAAVQKIILARCLKEEGMAIYQSALCVYSLFLTLALGGMPISVTHFISKERSYGREDRIFKAMRASFFVMLLWGTLLSVIMFLFRGFFSASMKDFNIQYTLAALSPSVFIVCVGALTKSCFEGYSNMLPCALSQIIEACIKLISAAFLASFFSIFSASYASLGAAMAITLGEASATAVLFIFFVPFLKKIKEIDFCGTKKVCAQIMEYALPLTLYSVALSSLNLTENAVIRNSLLSIRFSEGQARAFFLKYSAYTSVFDTVIASRRLTLEGANWLYGAFFGYAMAIIHFPCGLLKIFSVTLFPIASKHFAKKDKARLEKLLSKVIRTILVISIPLCALIIAFSNYINRLLFGCCVYSSMLIFAAPILVLAPISSILLSVEYASGRVFVPFLFGFLSFMISIPLCFILIKIPQINILGAAIASIAGMSCEILLSLLFITRRLGINIRLFYQKKEIPHQG